MNRLTIMTLALVMFGLRFVILAQADEPAPPKGETAQSKLRFENDGDDLLIKLTIDGPAIRQAVVTDYVIDDGRPPWDEPPVGVEKPRRPPRIELRYLVIVNRDLPGFDDGGLLDIPTPENERRKARQEVVWRIPNRQNWGFRKEEAKFVVHSVRFETTSEQLLGLCPKLKETVDRAKRRRDETGPGEAP